MFWQPTTLNCCGRLVDLSQPLVMAIVNLTPDSFYDGGRNNVPGALDRHLDTIVSQGADILDLGAMSSRPGAQIIDPGEEIQRLKPALKRAVKLYPEQIISVDTIHAEVAEMALSEGAHMINDISAWSFDPDLLQVVVKHQAPYVLMHMQGQPGNMQEKPHYDDVLAELIDFFASRLRMLVEKGVHDIIIDPGFGFGKTLAHNFTLLSNLHVFQMLDKPILVGISRKKMIQKVVGVNVDEALNGTTALHMVALQQGARILRVHDVAEARECIKLWQKLQAHVRS